MAIIWKKMKPNLIGNLKIWYKNNIFIYNCKTAIDNAKDTKTNIKCKTKPQQNNLMQKTKTQKNRILS